MYRVVFQYARATQEMTKGTEKVLAQNTKKGYSGGQRKLSQIFQVIFVGKAENLGVENLFCWWIPGRHSIVQKVLNWVLRIKVRMLTIQQLNCSANAMLGAEVLREACRGNLGGGLGRNSVMQHIW